ncbi:MAG: Glu-tRNA(Gln) amidotransferase subunit GatD [Nanoarchaeales archaeon]|nr:Glu-tRNA(Gln) amidotransferase subunit GatD [Nanoarchaeales archaeon]
MTKILEVDYKGEIIKGPLLKEDETYFMIKLSSGYNASLKKVNCKIISETDIEDTNSNEQSKKKSNKSKLPKITMLHTGGTIASKVDYRTGAVSNKFTPEELLNLFPELNEIADIKANLIGNFSSEDLGFTEQNIILKNIIESVNDGADGIIIGHGTDTLHYTAAFLQYALRNLKIPVIIVGAQRSSDRASSDAFLNLQAATQFIIQNKNKEHKFNRVGICMHATTDDKTFNILDGINARKMHSTQRDAFKQINYSPFARMDLKHEIQILRPDLETKSNEEETSFIPYNEDLKIGFFKAHPNMYDWELDHLVQYDAVVLEGTGVGNIGANNDNFKKDNLVLKKLSEICDKVKVFSGVQTVYGQVSLGIYSRGRDIKESGVIGDRTNLTTESTFCRAAHVLSCEGDFDENWEENHEGFDLISKQIK